MSLLGPVYQKQVTSKQDIAIASIAWGFTLGFGFLTTWEGIKQTRQTANPWKSIYVWFIWGELSSSLILSIICWVYLNDVIKDGFVPFFIILLLWTVQVHCLLQIIINRIKVILPNPRPAIKLQWIVFAIVVFINISVFCIWIPAHLGTSKLFIKINLVWDRIEKVLYLVIDAGLNMYFVREAQNRLVRLGSTKYQRLVTFNVRIIFLSLLMDCLIIGAMSLKNGVVYLSIHPLAYIVKLNIELSMADLIRVIARQSPNPVHQHELKDTYEFAIGRNKDEERHDGKGVLVRKQVTVLREERTSEDGSETSLTPN